MAELTLAYRLQREAFELNVKLLLPGCGLSVLFGPSGAGKTTLLRCIAGLQKAQHETLTVQGRSWQGLPTHRRPLAMVFQQQGLLEHLTARDNIRYALKRRGGGRQWQQVLELFAIGKLLHRYPAQLSGGEQQRVALARAVLTEPQLLLMDEPLAALDEARKQDILPYIERLKAELKIPIIYVTHSQREAARLADYMVVLQQGRVSHSGALPGLLNTPGFPFASANTVGVVINATVAAIEPEWGLATLAFDGGQLRCNAGSLQVAAPVRVSVLARDVSLSRSRQRDTSILNVLPAIVEQLVNEAGSSSVLVYAKMGATPVIARITRYSAARLQLAAGSKVWLQLKSVAVVR